MDSERDERKVKKKSKMGRYAYGYFVSPLRWKFFRLIRSFIGSMLILVLVYMLLSGSLNQRITFNVMLEWCLDIGHKFTDFFDSLREGTSPFKFEDGGVYFKDANVPNGTSLDLEMIDEEDRSNEWKGLFTDEPESE